MTSAEEIKEKLKAQFGDSILELQDQPNEVLVVRVDLSKLEEVATFIKHDLGFIHPNTLIGTDYLDENRIEVSWYVERIDAPLILSLTVDVDRENPICPSLTYIWEGFNWEERETYDMLGVLFDGHPDLRRILLPDDWDGHPLREDYVYKRPMYKKPEDFDPEEYKRRF